MGRRLFRFQKFAMTDEHCGMRIGTDAVLLGAWAATDNGIRRIADIGTGCGIIALMLAQRVPEALVEGVETEPGACLDARTNFEASPWRERMVLHECSFEDLGCQNGRYDLIVSNPPFFTEALHSPDAVRAAARHAGTLCFPTLAAKCRQLLTAVGRLAVVLPAADDEPTLLEASLNRLYPRRHCRVRTRSGEDAVRSLWEFSPEDGDCTEEELIIRNDDMTYSERYCRLTAEFHPFSKTYK